VSHQLGRYAQILIAGAVAALPLAACASKKPPPEPLSVTEANTGGSVALARDQQLIVRLPSNPTTGYRWSLAQQSTPVLQPEGAPTYEKGAVDAGAGGTEIWRFAPTQAGEGTLRLEYRRLWEADVAPARVVSYKVTVREPQGKDAKGKDAK
jgi:inhibitor of cysteine peptidase